MIINKKGTVQTGECTVPFYMKKRGNNVTERLVDSSIVGFIINDNGYHYHCQWFSKNIYKTLYILNRDKKNSINAVLFR